MATGMVFLSLCGLLMLLLEGKCFVALISLGFLTVVLHVSCGYLCCNQFVET